MSFRLRLTLASAAAVALAVAAACAIAYIVVGQRLYGQVDSALRAEAAAAAPAVGTNGQIPSPGLFSSTDLDFRVVPSLPQPDGYVVANTAQSTALFTALRTGRQLPDYGKQGVSAVDASNVAATILNGTKLAGVAAQASTALAAKGYTVLRTGNADLDLGHASQPRAAFHRAR